MRRSQLVSAVLGLAALAAAGCTDAGATLQIMQNQVPNANCIPGTSLSGTFLSAGVYDVQSTVGYRLFPLVRNTAQRISSEPQKRVAFIEGADVELVFQGGSTKTTQFFSGNIQPASFSAFTVFAITPDQTADLRAQIPAGDVRLANLELLLFGEMDGGDVESNTFTFPIMLCNGCLKTDLGACESLPANFEATDTGFVCDPDALQDEPVECCTTAGGAELCPAQAVTAEE